MNKIPPPLLSQERVASVDLLKGLGILLVVIGHCPDPLGLHRWIYAFHMPLFAFIGGLFLKSAPFREFVRKKAVRLLVPFFVWSLFFWVLYGVIIYVTEPALMDEQLKKIILIVGGSGQNAIRNYANVALWFLPFLFSSSMIWFVLSRLSVGRQWLEYVGVLTIATIGLFCGFMDIKLPYKLNTAFTLYPFFWAGFRYFRLYGHGDRVVLNCRWIIMLVCVAVFIPSVLFNVPIDTASNVVGKFGLFYLGAFAAIILLTVLCRMVGKVGFICFLGRNSLVILIFHMPLIQLVMQFLKPDSAILLLLVVPVVVILLCLPLIGLLNRSFPQLIGLR